MARDWISGGGHRVVRCPWCMSRSTTWVAAPAKPDAPQARVPAEDTLLCETCGRSVGPPKRAGDGQTWDGRAEQHLTCDDFFTPTYGLERAAAEEGAALERFIATRERAHETTDVAELVGYIREDHDGVVPWLARVFWDIEQQLVTELAEWFFRGRAISLAMLRRFERFAPNRSPFGTLGQVLRFRRTGAIGLGSLYVTSNDGPTLRIAETKRDKPAPVDADGETDEEVLRGRRELRRAGGMRGGVVHATSSSHNGSVGGARNEASIGLEHDIDRAIGNAVYASRAHPETEITWDDVNALYVLHANEGADGAVPRLDRRGAFESLLRDERKLRGDEQKPAVDAVIAEHKARLSGRLERATKRIEFALRAIPANAFETVDGVLVPVVPGAEVPILRPALPEREERPWRRAPVAPPAYIPGMPMPEVR